jgi:hypothetical protein
VREGDCTDATLPQACARGEGGIGAMPLRSNCALRLLAGRAEIGAGAADGAQQGLVLHGHVRCERMVRAIIVRQRPYQGS